MRNVYVEIHPGVAQIGVLVYQCTTQGQRRSHVDVLHRAWIASAPADRGGRLDDVLSLVGAYLAAHYRADHGVDGQEPLPL